MMLCKSTGALQARNVSQHSNYRQITYALPPYVKASKFLQKCDLDGCGAVRETKLTRAYYETYTASNCYTNMASRLSW